MYVAWTFGKCDGGHRDSDGNYVQCENVATVQAIARGNTGRYCAVLGFCDSCLDDEAEVWTMEQAYAWIEEQGNGYPDF